MPATRPRRPREISRPSPIPQRGRGLAARIAYAFEDVGDPAFMVGTDTPQLDRHLLSGALAALGRPGVDAVLGPCVDGGYWGVGLRRPRCEAFVGVPMSASHTYAAQAERFAELGLVTREREQLRDVDCFADAEAVAAQIPASRFAAVTLAVTRSIRGRSGRRS